MCPADHPEFFTRPPPEGRSRESSIVLDRHGRFFHEGAPVEHPGMARAFASWIDRHPFDGRFILNNGFDWSYFTVEDAPFFVRSVDGRGGAPVLSLSDGTREPLDPSTLAVGEAEAVYARVKGDRFEARFLSSAQLSLAPWLVETEPGAAAIELDGRRFPIPRRG